MLLESLCAQQFLGLATSELLGTAHALQLCDRWLQKVQLQDLDTPEYRTCKACGGSGLSKGYFKA